MDASSLQILGLPMLAWVPPVVLFFLAPVDAPAADVVERPRFVAME